MKRGRQVVEISDWYEDEDASPQEEGEEERETDRIAGGVRRGSGSPGFAAPVVLQGRLVHAELTN